MSNHTDRFYNIFSVFYPLADIFLKPQKRRLLYEINTLTYGQLLEIGVGNGSHLPLYKTHHIIGIDTSINMLRLAKKKKREDIELIEMNGEALLFKDQIFDYVILSHVLAVADNPEKVLAETYRVLKPGGKVFILNHFTPNNWLKYIDKSFQLVSKWFHFKSVFYISNIAALKKFTLLKEINFGKRSYFKLLIYSKA